MEKESISNFDSGSTGPTNLRSVQCRKSNIARFNKLIAVAASPGELETLRNLLEIEEAKIAIFLPKR